MYQGRQYHGWFGHGTGPGKPSSDATPDASAEVVEQRIRDLGHTLIAGLPRSKRYHDAAQLSDDDHARLVRLLTAVVRALPLGLAGIARRIFGKDADTPGIARFIQAAGLLRHGRDNADLRAATDALGQAAQEIGLDHFKPFLRRADEHLAAQGGLLTLVRDLPQVKPPPVEEPPVRIPTLPMPGRLPLAPAVVWLGLQVLPSVRRMIEDSNVRSTIERFGLDMSKPADVTAAYAFLWAQTHGPWIFDTPQTGPEMLAMAERVMRIAQADPDLFARALKGDADAQNAVSAAIKTAPPGSGIETRRDEERALVAQLVSEGKTAAEIQAALDQHRAQGRKLTTREQRRMPKTVSMSKRLPPAKKGWLLEGLNNKNGVAIPGQVADKLIGRRYARFDGLREAIWRLIAQTPELAAGLDDRNLEYMRSGNGPVPPNDQQVTVRSTGRLSDRSWELHHDPAIAAGGAVYDLSTLRIVTPKQHDAITHKGKSP